MPASVDTDEFSLGDRVQDMIWDGRHVGEVVELDEAGRPYVLWDGEGEPELMMPSHVARIDQPKAA